ncbi:MAG: hypothetical protein PCFJNLEI_01834 [Verrucomicrobiae bacterium]|nr:hypothetical protein [Verrucomicrobiae bacterium]
MRGEGRGLGGQQRAAEATQHSAEFISPVAKVRELLGRNLCQLCATSLPQCWRKLKLLNDASETSNHTALPLGSSW